LTYEIYLYDIVLLTSALNTMTEISINSATMVFTFASPPAGVYYIDLRAVYGGVTV